MNRILNNIDSSKLIKKTQFVLLMFLLLFSAEAFGATAKLNCLSDPCGGDEGVALAFDAEGSDTTSSNTTIHSISWDFGDSQTGTTGTLTQNINHTFKKTGVFTVLLDIRYNNNSHAYDEIYVTINNKKPKAELYGTDYQGVDQSEEIYVYVNKIYTFYGVDSIDHSPASGKGIDEYAWDWDWKESEPFVPAEANYTYDTRPHVWDTLGDYRIGLRVLDDDVLDGQVPAEGNYDYKSMIVHVIPECPSAVPNQNNQAIEGSQTFFSAKDLFPANAENIIFEWDFNYSGDEETFNPMATGKDVDYAFPDTTPNQSTDVPFRVALRTVQLTEALDGDYDLEANSDCHVIREIIGGVSPTNVLPVADLKLWLLDSSDQRVSEITKPYTIKEGDMIEFDASASTTNPGAVQGVSVRYQWDWTYVSGNFREETNTFTSTVKPTLFWTKAEFEDATVLNIALRVSDDDDDPLGDFPSEEIVPADITITEVKPQAYISGPDTLQEGEKGSFTASDTSQNVDPITTIEWDLDYDPNNPSNFADPPDATGTEPAEKEWNTPQDAYIAVRITDDDGFSSVISHKIVITDKAPTAIITADKELPVFEGDDITFSSQGTQIGPDDRFVIISWDEDYNGTFNGDHYEITSTCDVNRCSRAPWISCDYENPCPRGKGTLTRSYPDGPTVEHPKVALCIIDNDAVFTEVDGDVENDDPVRDADATLEDLCKEGSPYFAVMQVPVKNKAPEFQANTNDRTVYEGSKFTFQPNPKDPGGSNDPLTYSIIEKPAGMQFISPNTGRLEWYPSADDVSCTPGQKQHKVSLKVEDDDGGEDTLAFYIDVLDLNDPPEIKFCDPKGVAAALSEYTTTIVGFDPDKCNKQVSYFIKNKKTGMSIGYDTGVFTWTPTEAQIGTTEVDLCVKDHADEEICCQHVIDVGDPKSMAICSAGADQTDVNPGWICQTGSVTKNPQDKELEYLWEQKGDTPEEVILENLSEYKTPPGDPAPSMCFASSAHGEFSFGLACKNEWTTGPEDTAAISILNVKPTAIVIGNRNYDVGTTVSLDATRSMDYNSNDLQDYLQFAWEDIDQALTGSPDLSASELEFTPTQFGVYNFRVTVDDQELASNPTSLKIEILDIDSKKALPYATFTPITCDSENNCSKLDTGVTAKEIMLDASASSSRINEEAVTYKWIFRDGPVAENRIGMYYNQDEEEKLFFTPPEAGKYEFSLTVKDSEDNTSNLFVDSIYIGQEKTDTLEVDMPPVASAGTNQKVNLHAPADTRLSNVNYVKVTLNGSGSLDPEGEELVYRWSQLEGVNVPLIDDATATPSFIAFHSGIYVFSLTVYDGAINGDNTLASKPSIVAISVAPEGNAAPSVSIANLDPYTQSLIVNPNEPVIIDASNSIDPEKTDLTYEWTQISGPAIVLSSWDKSIVSFQPDINDVTYVFRLVVRDVGGAPSLPMNINVRVLKNSNAAPVCVVKETSIATVMGLLVTLDASESFDSDEGDAVEHVWKQIEGETVTLTPTETPGVVNFKPLQTGEYKFSYVAFDGVAYCKEPKEITVTATENTPPVAQAGADAEFCFKKDQVKLDGSASTDVDGHEITYEWSVEEGTAFTVADFSDTTVAKPEIDAISSGRVKVKLVVNDGFTDSDPDYVWIEVQTCIEKDCKDNDGDGYYVGSDCTTEKEDCNDDDATVPDPNPCEDCIDNDADGYGVGADCTGKQDCDDNDPMKNPGDGTCGGVVGPDVDDDGGGGGCTQSNHINLYILLAMIFACALVAKRKRRKRI